MVKRDLNWKKHLLTLTITLLLFTVGVIIGIKLSDERIEYTQSVATQQKLEYESLQLQLSYLDKNNQNCDLLMNTLERNLYDLEQQRFKLEEYISDSNDEEYNLIKKEYILTEIRYWMLARDAGTFCDVDFVPVLYFYLRDQDCDKCSTQGHILTYVKDKLKQKVLIFSLDSASEEPMVGLLKQSFNVTEAPTVIIDGEKFDGLVKTDKVVETVCSHLANPTEFCRSA